MTPAAETARYIDSLGPQALAKAAAYTHGNHWLLLWGLLVAAAVTLLFVRLRILDRIDARLARRGWALRTWVLCAVFFLLSALVTLPWDIYTGWIRETAYDRTSQPLGDWLGQAAISTVITALLGGLFFLGVYALIRRTGKRWWIWSGGLAAIAISAFLLVAPIAIEPLFNKYTPVPEGPVRDALVEMAAKADIPADRIYMFDGSRQSNNFTANVSGIGHSARIAISASTFTDCSFDHIDCAASSARSSSILGETLDASLLADSHTEDGFHFTERGYAMR